MNYDTYIFDLDGTLLNTLDDLAASCNHALSAFGLPTHSSDDVRRFVGNGVRKLIERAVPDGTDNPLYDKVLSAFQEYYLQHSQDHTAPYPGILPMLHELWQQGKQLAVVSNKFCDATRQLVAFYFGDIIPVAMGEKPGIRKKPAPDMVLEAMRLLHADPATTVYVGDSDVDIETARRCQLPCISVAWGFRDTNFLLQHGATTIINLPEELPKLSAEPLS